MSQFSLGLKDFLLKRFSEEQIMELYYKIGFHTGPGGNRDGIGDYWKILDSAGIPAVLISVDDYGPCYELDLLAKASGVPHVNVYRIHVKIPNFNADVPRYELEPDEAADIWWKTIRSHLPPEMISGSPRDRVWLIAGNEMDKNRASWLGYWALGVARRANAEGFKIAAFGWSSGEPEYDDWTEPGMAEYLRYCAKHPDEAAVATHEYSYTLNVDDGLGYLIGRFDFINDACYTLGIQTPKIFITEWGWTYQIIPGPITAMTQMLTIADLYGNHPEVKGAMLWYLGGGFGDIANQAQKLIVPVTDVSLAWGYSPGPVEPPPVEPPSEGEMTDLAEFFKPKPGLLHGPIYMLYNNWGQGPERTHLARSPKGSTSHFYVSKNGRWERRYVGDHWIWLQADTSRADNEFYKVYGDPWLPRFMQPGDTYFRTESTIIFALDSCQEVDSGVMTSGIKFIGPAVALSTELGLEVIELNWLVGGIIEERYFYAKNVGLVAWEKPKSGLKSKLEEFVPEHELPNVIEWVCLVLDEAVPVNAPEPPNPPPPSDTLEQEAWDKTVAMQVTGIGGIRLNKDAGIQQLVTAHNKAGLNLQKVTDEVIIDGHTFMAAESLTGACPRRVYVWQPGLPIYFFEDPG